MSCLPIFFIDLRDPPVVKVFILSSFRHGFPGHSHVIVLPLFSSEVSVRVVAYCEAASAEQRYLMCSATVNVLGLIFAGVVARILELFIFDP